MSIRLDGRRSLHVKERDRVKTVTGRRGRVLRLKSGGDEAVVLWDDGEEFSLRVSHLSLIEDDG